MEARLLSSTPAHLHPQLAESTSGSEHLDLERGEHHVEVSLRDLEAHARLPYAALDGPVARTAPEPETREGKLMRHDRIRVKAKEGGSSVQHVCRT